MSPALARLIEALAEQAAQDYLSEQAALLLGSGTDRSEPVPLPALDKAA
jgi:hypothetical protein